MTTDYGWLLSVGYAILAWSIVFGALIVIPFRRSPAAAQGWLILFFFQPLVALLIYLLIGNARHPKWRRERIRHVPALVRRASQDIPDWARDDVASELPPRSRTRAHLVRSLGQLPCVPGNAIRLDADYNRVVDRMATDVDNARDHVHVMFYILQDDEAGNRMLSAMERAAARGVKCRLLIDAVGSATDRNAIIRRLDGTGVEVKLILPLRFWNRATRADLRNHRKIVVVDGRVGWVGSQNMHRMEYEPNTFYREVMARVTGPVVLALQSVFVGDWFLETDEDISGPTIMPAVETEGSAYAQVLPSGPDHPDSRIDALFTDLVHSATHRVVLTTPYFIPNEPLLLALRTAVEKGVHVTLFVTATTNSFFIDHAQRSYYDELLYSGVEVMLYRERFLHAKHLSIDDDIAVIGSANMDRRSFELNSEVTLIVYDASVVAQLRRIENDYRAKSRRLTTEDWEERGFPVRLAENVMRLVSPLL